MFKAAGPQDLLRILICTHLALASMAPAALALPEKEVEDPPPAKHAEDIERCRVGILGIGIGAPQRKLWAEQLFSYDSDDARQLAIELLAGDDRPDVQRALCDVIVDRARQYPERLHTFLVAPLMNLLGNSVQDLRSAAARALAAFPGPSVPAELSALAADPDESVDKRMAAIDALAPNIHRRGVVKQLIGLLDVSGEPIQAHVMRALTPASLESFGHSRDAWRAWWRNKKTMSEEAWLADQTQIYRSRLRTMEESHSAELAEMQRHNAALSLRLSEFARELFLATSAERADAVLVEWLDDPLPEVSQTALDIIKSRISDEGQRPQGDVLDALLRLLRDDNPILRREVLLVVQNLADPKVLLRVLAQLENETDPHGRHAIFVAIGKMNRPEAAPALIKEINSLNSPPDCVREAAASLGQIAPRVENAEILASATAALKVRYQAASAEDNAMRGSLLSAMAGIGDKAFSAEFFEAVEDDAPVVLRPAIRGLVRIRDGSKLPRLRSLTAHADPLVRIAAIDAVGSLGREDADMECLLVRLNSSNENNPLAKEAAWRAFRSLVSGRSLDARIKIADRLRDVPDLEVVYLTELLDDLPNGNGDSSKATEIHAQIADLHIALGNSVAAVPHLRDVYRKQSVLDPSIASAAAVRWVAIALQSIPRQDVAVIVVEILGGPVGVAAGPLIADTIDNYVNSPDAPPGLEELRSLARQLATVSSQNLPSGWAEMMQRLEQRAAEAEQAEAPSNP